jgi:hypothetical protein
LSEGGSEIADLGACFGVVAVVAAVAASFGRHRGRRAGRGEAGVKAAADWRELVVVWKSGEVCVKWEKSGRGGSDEEGPE